jgi:hypothetical protein
MWKYSASRLMAAALAGSFEQTQLCGLIGSERLLVSYRRTAYRRRRSRQNQQWPAWRSRPSVWATTVVPLPPEKPVSNPILSPQPTLWW